MVTTVKLRVDNLLLATDFSACSARALGFALGIAGRYGAKLHLLHCVDPVPYNLLTPEAVEMACDAARRDMRDLESDIRGSGLARDIEVEGTIEAAAVEAVLPPFVKLHDIGLIVIGTHGRTGWRKLVLGSVAESIMDQVACPVLTVGPASDRTRIQHFGPENILVATDGSEGADRAVDVAAEIAYRRNWWRSLRVL